MVEHERTGPLDLVTWSFSRVAMWAPFFIVLIILYEVVMRYFFAAATLWVNEMSLWIAGGIYLSAGLYAMQQRSHIRIFIIYDLAPLWLRRTFDVISVICVIIFAFAVFWGGFGEATTKFWRFETFGTAYDPPIPATIKPLVLVMMLFLALQATSNLVRDWPAADAVRKVFDVLVSLFIAGLVLATAYALYLNPKEGNAVPTKWLVGIGVFLLATLVLTIIGLVRDFNTRPSPMTLGDEIEEEAAAMREHAGLPEDDGPDNVLSGNPPRPKE